MGKDGGCDRLRRLSRSQAHCQGEYFDSSCAGSTQRTAAFVDGAAGGEDIINQQDLFLCELDIMGREEGFFQVASPLFATEMCLRNSGPIAQEQVDFDSILPVR